MEFLRLLEIDRSLLAPEAEKSLLLADRICAKRVARVSRADSLRSSRRFSSAASPPASGTHRFCCGARKDWSAAPGGLPPVRAVPANRPACQQPRRPPRGERTMETAPPAGERESWFVGVDSQGLCAPAEPTYVASSKSRFSCVVALPQLTGHRNVASCHF
jgi:hypothetical protein